MATFARWEVHCTAWGCPTTGSVDIPGAVQLGTNHAAQVLRVLRSHGWVHDMMGLLCPAHTHMAIGKGQVA